jgi:hypothetical protein
MRCDEFEARLNQVLDDRRPLSSADDLQAHLRQCGGCRETARSYEALLAALGYEVLPAAPAWLADRVLDDLAVNLRPPDRQELSRFPGVAVFSMAAAVLLAVGLALLNDSKRVGDNGPAVGNTSVARAQRASHDRRQMERATAKTSALATSTVDAPQGRNAADTNAAETNAAAHTGAFPPADWAPAGAEWVQDVADGLQPVTQPTMGAISGFLNLWGIGQQGHRS